MRIFNNEYIYYDIKYKRTIVNIIKIQLFEILTKYFTALMNIYLNFKFNKT